MLFSKKVPSWELERMMHELIFLAPETTVAYIWNHLPTKPTPMTREEHLRFCEQCTNRKMDSKRGLICSLTGEIADFEGTCEHFIVDEAEKAAIEARETKQTRETVETLGYDRDMPPEIRTELQRHQDLFLAIVGGLFVAVISALLWAFITVSTGYQIGYMAIAVGLLVGFGVQYFGAGVDLKFGIVGASLAFFGCLLGNALSQIAFIAEAENLEMFQTYQLLGFSGLAQVLSETFSPMDLVFYGIAVYEGFKFAFRRIPDPMPIDGDLTPVASKLRLPLAVVFFVILAGVGFIALNGAKDGGQFTYYYEDGSVQAQGGMAGGVEHGEWKVYYPDGTLQSEGAFENGLEEGEWKFYNERAQLIKVGGYKLGLVHGLWEVYNEYGELVESSQYKEGRLHGPYKSYHSDGVLNEEGEYVRSLKEGPWKVYYPNGNLNAGGSFKNDAMHGTWHFYYEDGKESSELVYDEGGRQRFMNIWDESGEQTITNGNGLYERKGPDGQVLQRGRLEDGLAVGEWKSYFSSGQISEIGMYQDSLYVLISSWNPEGLPMVVEGNGMHTAFDESGEYVLEEGEMLNGLREGEWMTYYPEIGTIQQRMNYTKGKRNGAAINYFQSGGILFDGYFTNDKQDGTWFWYYESGGLETSVTYVNGKKEGEQVFNSELGVPVKEEYYENGVLVDERMY